VCVEDFCHDVHLLIFLDGKPGFIFRALMGFYDFMS